MQFEVRCVRLRNARPVGIYIAWEKFQRKDMSGIFDTMRHQTSLNCVVFAQSRFNINNNTFIAGQKFKNAAKATNIVVPFSILTVAVD